MANEEYVSELIQVAAVAIAALTDYGHGSTNPSFQRTIPQDILEVIDSERRYQEKQWGTRHYSPMEWLAILTEEVGEVAKAIVDDPATWVKHPSRGIRNPMTEEKVGDSNE